MGKNIFQIWKENGESLPFKVRRENWTLPNVFILVEKIHINKFPYGIAYGKSMEIDNEGNENISKFQYHCKNGIVGCSGCFQWELFEKKKDSPKPHFAKIINYAPKEDWRTDVLIGQRGSKSHGHLVASGATIYYLRDEQGKEIIVDGEVVKEDKN